MRKYLLCGLLATFVWACGPSFGESGPAKVAEAYLAGLVSGEADAAFDALLKFSRIDEQKPREMELIKGQIAQALQLYGKPSAFEDVSTEIHGSSIVRLTYYTKHRELPLVWNFVFYRPEKEWLLLTFEFNDQLRGIE